MTKTSKTECYFRRICQYSCTNPCWKGRRNPEPSRFAEYEHLARVRAEPLKDTVL